MEIENKPNLTSEEEKHNFIPENWGVLINIILSATFAILKAFNIFNLITTDLVLIYLAISVGVMFVILSKALANIQKKFKTIIKIQEECLSREEKIISSLDITNGKVQHLSEVQLSQIQSCVQNIITEVAGFTQSEVIIGTDNFYKRLTTFYSDKNTKTIDVTYFTPYIPDLDRSDISQYWNQIPILLEKNKNIIFRRIATIESIQKFEWLIKDMYNYEKIDGFNLRILNTDMGTMLLNVIIINCEDVFIFDSHHQENDKFQKYVYVRNSEIGSSVDSYFGHIWESATVIKKEKTINKDNIKLIRKNLRNNGHL